MTLHKASAKLANGETIVPGEHVYVSPPWSERDGTPYIVARIIEFLPPNSTPRKGARPQHASELNVRLSLYYRPSDISGRNVSDFRLLLAAIHTDIQPLSNVRGKCYVRHKDRLDDVLAWKRLPDHFYFVKFFDPYIKREYEVIRTENVHNIPPHVKDSLLQRYEYLVTEREMVADLTDSFRACCVCDKWAASQESVKCEACKKHYHMTCLSPPLLAKPAKGYSWVCVPCSLQRRKDVAEQKFHYASTTAPRAKAAVKAKEPTGSRANSNRPDVTYRGWPFRYFGLYTRAEDTVDPDDLIFPKAATRVGTKFQANVPSWEEQQEAETHEMEAGPSRHIGFERGHDNGERKHESTIDVLSTPSTGLDTFMQNAAKLSLPVPAWDVERLNRSAISYTTLGPDRGMKALTSLKLADYRPIIFNEKEISVFESQLEENGGLDAYRAGKQLSKRPAEVLRFSYIWKNKKLKVENEALRAHLKVNTTHAKQNKTLGAPSLGRIRASNQSDVGSDDDISLYGAETLSKPQCAACSTRLSEVWWKCPRTVPGVAMCETCGANYRKYGVIQFTKAEDSKRVSGDSKKEQSKKKIENGAAVPPPPPPKLPPCACCRKMEPKATMARCKTCTFSAHAGCYGIPPESMGPEWECELCANLTQEESHLQPTCVLCPRDLAAVRALNKSKKPAADFDLLSALKPTEGCQWAHILCSVWMPNVVYTKPQVLKRVEGITTLPRERWEETCSLCGLEDGALIDCSECAVQFHAACAWTAGHRFGFSFSLAKPGKKEVVTVVDFKESQGVMHAGCWCKGHDMEGKTVYDMYELDPDQNETALQIYVNSYKTLPQDNSFALLRKATRLDQVTVRANPEPEQVVKVCADCGIDVSPRWHDVASDAMEVDGVEGTSLVNQSQICHQCWFNRD